MLLNDIEMRVLGSLMEKALSTPDYYPLSLNALTNACNQKSSRDPVVTYEEETVEEAADDLIQKELVNKSVAGRVPKYEETFSSKYNFIPQETAALCALLLRGPQTAGEIRSRTSRMFSFQSVDEVLQTLNNLNEYGLVDRLAKLPGHKESRYTHLLGSELDEKSAEAASPPVSAAPALPDRIQTLEQRVAAIQDDIEDLKKAFQAFKAQFE
jgi:uncharacterized protein YceH (UPF0502 family)